MHIYIYIYIYIPSGGEELDEARDERLFILSFISAFGKDGVVYLGGGEGQNDKGATLHPAPCTLHPAPCTLHPAPYTLHPEP